MARIESIEAIEVLDSRGRPTVLCRVTLAGGATAAASVPSGASTGAAEALELRDGDPSRYAGLGCRKAVVNVTGPIAETLRGKAIESQAELDRALIELDGTPNKSALGANAILAVSLAYCRAEAAARGVPLHEHVRGVLTSQAGIEAPHRLPRPTINLFSGGEHAGGQVAIQDVLIVPSGGRTFDACMAMSWAVYQAAARLCGDRYASRALTADEGGLAPPFESNEAALGLAVASIEAAGLTPGDDVHLAVDVASSHFFAAGRYAVDGPNAEPLDAQAMIGRVVEWIDRFPVVSVEDGLAEEDWAHWPDLRRAAAGRALVLGDDLLCTNAARIRRAIDADAADALLLKVNQVGTVSEAIDALAAARAGGWAVTVSARSGETEDDWLADLAVGLGGDQIKVGSVTQSERLAKYNRLLAIEAATGWPVNPWPGA